MRPILPLLLSSLVRRETPQELSHDRYILQVKDMLDLNNTIGVSDPTYGLLINSMAATGMGSVTDPDCLQLTIADCAFTNAKSANSIDGLVASLIYRALERNTAAVGVASEPCSSFTPRNVELAAFKQHQDPASPGALANNKATVLELARQIYLVGGEPTDALNSGTFAPGDLSSTDITGNACNTVDCIFDGNRLIRDASTAEITDYVANCQPTVTSTIGISGSASTSAVDNGPSGSITQGTNSGATTTHTTTTTTPTVPGTTNPSSSTPTPSSTPKQTQQATTSSTAQQPATQNYQTYTGAYLGVGAPAVTGPDSNGMYHAATDSSSFNNVLAALSRSCDIQKNNCADVANEQHVSVSPCDTQNTDCKNETGSTNQ